MQEPLDGVSNVSRKIHLNLLRDIFLFKSQAFRFQRVSRKRAILLIFTPEREKKGGAVYRIVECELDAQTVNEQRQS